MRIHSRPLLARTLLARTLPARSFIARTFIASLVCLAMPLSRPLAAEASLAVSIDHARVLKIDRAAETVIIGNPSIVDVTVHDSETLVLTGRSYGITNIVILDADGEAIIDEQVAVRGFEQDTIRVFRQAERTTYSCSPICEPTVTIGDNAYAFANNTSQFQTRQSMATGGK